MILDIIIGIALIASIITGIVKGLIKEISVIIGIMFGFYIASQKSPALEQFLFKSRPSSSTHHIISFIIVFVIVLILIYLLGLLLQKAVQLVMLGWLDKILGGIFGFIKGLIIIWIILMLVTTILPNAINIVSKSKLAIQIIELGTNFTKIPSKIKTEVKPLTNKVKSSILLQISTPIKG